MRNPNAEQTRLSVFIGSPKLGLARERQDIIAALLEARLIPEGMELWAAGSRPTLLEISARLADRDAHVLILGARYGSLLPGKGIPSS